MATNAASDHLYRALVEAVGPDQVLIDPDTMTGYITDVTGRGPGIATAVVRPGNVDQVQRVLAACREFGCPVVPQGGNTGLVGGSIPHDGEVVLSLRRLNQVAVEPAAREVTVGAGVTIGALQEHARHAGLAYGVDLASRESATVGGTIATNAGGMGVVAHGDTGSPGAWSAGGVRRWQRWHPAQRSGEAERRSRPGATPGRKRRNARGDHRRPSSIGRGVRKQPVRVSSGGRESCRRIGVVAAGITALEFFDRRSLEAVVAHRDLGRPLPGDPPFYVLVESADPPNLADEAVAVVDPRLWSYREAIPDLVNHLGVSCKLDVGVPLERLDEFVAALDQLDLDGDRYLFGHLAEGTFHVNIIGAHDSVRVADQVLEVVVALGGAIAGEHGIGVDKARWWRQTTDPSLLAQNRRIKEALDPANILNPKVFWGGG